MPVQIEQESAVEHIANSAANAVADLNAAIQKATSRRELVLLRTLASALVEQLEQAERAALYRDEWFDEPRRQTCR